MDLDVHRAGSSCVGEDDILARSCQAKRQYETVYHEPEWSEAHPRSRQPRKVGLGGHALADFTAELRIFSDHLVNDDRDL